LITRFKIFGFFTAAGFAEKPRKIAADADGDRVVPAESFFRGF
jgi:hypothetical protein